MLSKLWNTVLYLPLYNLLIGLTALFGGSAGLGIIGLTLIVKGILLPFTAKSIKSQVALKRIEPELAKIRANHPEKDVQAKKTFELYKEHKVNPFTGCFLLLIQLPIIIALYRVVLGGFTPHPESLYSFVRLPETINTMFLGLDITAKHSIVLTILVAGLQFLQGWWASKNMVQGEQSDMQKAMQSQMKYFLPVMVGFITYTLPAGIGIYWTVNILVTIAQEYYIRGRYAKTHVTTS